ncbi:thioesterase II family protein [Amycolatopsis speibonae]|uniref:Thioesterase II family protein n=1 Tax=Amycolatopsis speibonae TaxID=1450224 RepID=A0ABV7P0P8_9PSEU
MMQRISRSIFRLDTTPADPAARIICFPYAGGAAQLFRSWPEALAPAEVLAITLPGRGVRLREPLDSDLRSIAHSVSDDLEGFLDRPYVLFGHSMGGLVAYECALELARRGLPGPLMLGVASTPAPHLVVAEADGPESDEQLVDRILRLGMDSGRLVEHPEAVAALLPGIRADFQAFDTYHCGQEPPLDIPISAWAGDQDTVVSPGNVAAWRAYTTREFTLTGVPAGHSYIEEQRDLILPPILNLLTSSLPEGALQ